MEGLEFFAGIDWGSETHQVCVVDSEGGVLAERGFTHGGAGLAEMADWILARAGVEAHAVGVAIEIPHGPVVETMMERGFPVHSVNPKQLDRFRDRFSPAGAKDDRRDARVLADALRTDSHAFRRLDPAAPEIIELREWSRIANDLTCDRTRLVNRARQQLWRYYPQLLKVESDLTRAWVCELWRLAPTPAASALTPVIGPAAGNRTAAVKKPSLHAAAPAYRPRPEAYQRVFSVTPMRCSTPSSAALRRSPSKRRSRAPVRAPSSRQPRPRPSRRSGAASPAALSRRAPSTSRPKARPALRTSARRQPSLTSRCASVTPSLSSGVPV